MIFFRLTSLELGLLFFGVLLGATGLGIFLGAAFGTCRSSLKEPFGILQGALLGVVGLLLAFGLSLAVSRYEDRRANVVTEANAIGTTYLRAQTLAEPLRSRSLDLLSATRGARCASRTRCRAAPRRDAGASPTEQAIQRRLWALAGEALDRRAARRARRACTSRRSTRCSTERPRASPPSATGCPTAVLVLEVLGAALALGLLAAYLAIVGRGVLAVMLASVLVAFLLLVTADLDRPTRGMIQVPDTVLRNQLASMEGPPAAAAPQPPSP